MKNNGTFVIGSWFQYTYGNSATADTSRLGGLQVSGASGYILNSYYSYDDNGNITRYNMTGGSDMEWMSLNTDEPVRMGETYYHYDTANQLVREDNMWLGKTFVWTYDDAGNITSCKEYAYIDNWEEVTGTPTKTNTYTYGDSAWGDLLTAYNGVQWSYDQIGNLTDDGTWEYTWQNGRELASMSNGSVTWNYTYDANGMRTSRSNGSTTYNYVYNGDQLVQMTKGSDTLYFTYGAIGPTTVTWNGTTYYYAVNAQGDVMGIFDGSGNCVVTYNWDNAWGYNPEPEGSMADTLGTLNPLRYRSYVYDEETGLYYLQSRYYDSEICRFLNADAFPATGQGMLGTNMYAYCGNNPVIRTDTGGFFWDTVFDVVSLCFSVAEVVKNPDDPMAWLGVAADVASLVVPCVSGGGALVRAATKADDVVDTVKAINKADDMVDIGKMATTGSPNSIGKIGEQLAGINPKAKTSIQVNGRTRIPDALTDSTLTEVKNVKYISNTSQLKDFATFAKNTGRTMDLYVRPTTKVAKTVIDAGWNIKYLW